MSLESTRTALCSAHAGPQLAASRRRAHAGTATPAAMELEVQRVLTLGVGEACTRARILVDNASLTRACSFPLVAATHDIAVTRVARLHEYTHRRARNCLTYLVRNATQRNCID